jgi:hypothetical protein
LKHFLLFFFFGQYLLISITYRDRGPTNQTTSQHLVAALPRAQYAQFKQHIQGNQKTINWVTGPSKKLNSRCRLFYLLKETTLQLWKSTFKNHVTIIVTTKKCLSAGIYQLYWVLNKCWKIYFPLVSAVE